MSGLNALNTPERAVALADIHAVLHGYAFLARDKAPFAEMQKFFWPDAWFRFPSGDAVRPTDIHLIVQGDEADYIRHHITTIDVQFVGENEARTNAQFFATTHLSFYDHWGAWVDIFRRSADGEWRIADRTIVLEGTTPGGWAGPKMGRFVKRE
ncbi:hypothetical protein SEUCBS139899_006128 [Sporothrix eucalyptigena]|uniref:SnoaL-like domain-containing protein n=1 Tax=Sporothrix eucalyptigena TaxID=1812306 RepID=A0ABP0CA64_9PEZI